MPQNPNIVLLCRAGWCSQPYDFDQLLEKIKKVLPRILPIVWHQQTPPEQHITQYQQAGLPIFGLGHSLGFAQLLETQINFSGVISLQGFTQFCSTPTNHNTFGTPLRILERMQQKLCTDPKQVVYDFRHHAGFKNSPHTPCQHMANEELAKLKNDIKTLIDLQIQLPKNTPILAIASEDDPIVNWGLTKACFSDQPLVSLEKRPNGHLHCLHQSDAQGCATLIGNWIVRSQYKK